MSEQPALIGKRLGTYEIQSLIGSGGMAQVYRGFDHTLQRAVAIKVLSAETAAQSGLPERFLQEARLIARLNHPNIVKVYTFGEQDGLTYLVEELLAGPTLATQIEEMVARGQRFGREQIVTIVSHIASALDAAHDAGIIHRDIKPDNAIWNAQGALVLTDFGIARQMMSDIRHTQTGTIVGTPHYLSPEQAQGLKLGPASDIYTLGVVLYELIAGKVPFTGDTPMTVVLGHIQETPPPLRNIRADLPPSVEAVVQRALEKEPSARFGSAGELARELERAWSDKATMPGVATVPAPPPGNVHEQQTRVWNEAPPPTRPAPTGQPAPQTRPISAPPPRQPTPPPQQPAPQPPRRRGVPVIGIILGVLLALLLIGGLVAMLGDEDEQSASAPDDTPTATLTAEAETSTPTVEATAEADATATPLPDPPLPPREGEPTGQIMFASARSGDWDIYSVNADGSNLRNLTNSGGGDFAPSVSPDGQSIAFHSGRNGHDEIYVMNADGSNLRQLTDNDFHDREPDWSPDGRSLVFWSGPFGNWDIYAVNVDGSNLRQVTSHFADEFAPAWSPDGQTIAFTTNRDGNDEIYLINADGSNERNITNAPEDDLLPAWSPDGQLLAFVSERDGNAEIYIMNADGSNPRNLTNHPSQDTQPIWSPDGQFIAFTGNRDGNDEIYTVNTQGENLRKLTNTVASEWDAAWAR
jgi:Tol biopolymer transport system component/serine/threonine protein kinase